MKKQILSLAASLAACWCVSANAQTIDLFNGKDLSNWNFVVDKNAANPKDVFKVGDGVIHIVGTPFGYMYTKERYDDFKLHVEWRWPNGEATNSGIFMFVNPDKKSNPDFVWPNGIECQLAAGKAGDFVLLNGSDLKEFVLPAGAKRPAFPVVPKHHKTVEMAVGEWNTADISCKDGNITVFINGKFMNKGSNSLHSSGHIALQSEGKDIEFRNVRLTPACED
jgi:hypothetical protein